MTWTEYFLLFLLRMGITKGITVAFVHRESSIEIYEIFFDCKVLLEAWFFYWLWYPLSPSYRRQSNYEGKNSQFMWKSSLYVHEKALNCSINPSFIILPPLLALLTMWRHKNISFGIFRFSSTSIEIDHLLLL